MSEQLSAAIARIRAFCQHCQQLSDDSALAGMARLVLALLDSMLIDEYSAELIAFAETLPEVPQ